MSNGGIGVGVVNANIGLLCGLSDTMMNLKALN
jgi:hypothetical protein